MLFSLGCIAFFRFFTGKAFQILAISNTKSIKIPRGQLSKKYTMLKSFPQFGGLFPLSGVRLCRRV